MFLSFFQYKTGAMTPFVEQIMSILSTWVSVLYKLNHDAKSLILTWLCLLKY